MLSPDVRPAKFGGTFDRGADHQSINAFVDVAEPLLQPHDGLAVGGKAEVPRLDDAGVHGSHRDLVHGRAFGGIEGVDGAVGIGGRAIAPKGWRTPQRLWSSHGRRSAAPSGSRP